MRILELTDFAELIGSCTTQALHLEMRDAYTPSDPSFRAFTGDGPAYDRTLRESSWHALISPAVARGVSVRRARIVSEPVTPYIRFEHSVTGSMNLAAGEQVRWLPRRHASDLCLPGNDFWLFDDRLVRWHHFAGNGEHLFDELTDDAHAVELCRSAFTSVWKRAIEHRDYRIA